MLGKMKGRFGRKGKGNEAPADGGDLEEGGVAAEKGDEDDG